MANQTHLFKKLPYEERLAIVRKWSASHRGWYGEELVKTDILNNNFSYMIPTYDAKYDIVMDHKKYFDNSILNNYFFKIQVKTTTTSKSKYNISLEFNVSYGDRKKHSYLDTVDLFALVDPVANIIAWKRSDDEEIYNHVKFSIKRKGMKHYTLITCLNEINDEIKSKDRLYRLEEENVEREKREEGYIKMLDINNGEYN